MVVQIPMTQLTFEMSIESPNREHVKVEGNCEKVTKKGSNVNTNSDEQYDLGLDGELGSGLKPDFRERDGSDHYDPK